MGEENRLGDTETDQMWFAFEQPSGDWCAKLGNVSFCDGFWRKLEIRQKEISQTSGPQGITVSFFLPEPRHPSDGSFDIFGCTVQDGVLTQRLVVAKNVRVKGINVRQA
jgi:hypothetical protein